MGMFDYVRVEMPLPGFNCVPDKDVLFQTKDLTNAMETYVITDSGELYREDCDYTFVDDSEHLLGGYIQEIPNTTRREYLTDHHGDIVFYISGKDIPGIGTGWVDYVARFTNGKLSRISMHIEDPD